MKIICMSDTHMLDIEVPPGDMIIHAGDMTMEGTFKEVAKFGEWLRQFPHKHKVVIAGNHDFLFERDPLLALHALGPGITYLRDEMVEIEGIKIYGSPWQPRFYDWAFNADRGEDIERHWKKIPEGIDILVTHGPPAGILDMSKYSGRVGCADLLKHVRRVKPKLHIFGHIHESGGNAVESEGTVFINAATGYRAEHPAMEVEVEATKLGQDESGREAGGSSEAAEHSKG